MSDELRSWTVHESPIGPLTLIAGARGITDIHFEGHAPPLPQAARVPMAAAVAQLDAYFAGELHAFELGLELRGAPLQRAVWDRLLEIPYGTTSTYGEIARQLDESLFDPELEPYRRPRVVGAAIGSNPVPVLVPCHRVIGADGSLTGFFGGLDRKRALLDLEGGAYGKRAAKARPSSQLALLPG